MKREYRVVITGASSGIGRALAEAFASRGVKVGIAARNTDRLEALKEKYPDNTLYETIDINNQKAPERLHDLIKRLGGMDLYIHAAGIGYKNPHLDTDTEVRTVETNTVGFARMVSAAYRYFRDRRCGGQIAAISSVAGTKGIGAMAAYSASKRFDSTYLTALEQLNRRQNAGVYFTDIRPGWVRTPLLIDGEKYMMEMSLEEVVPQILEAIIHRRRVAVIDFRWRLLVALWRLIPNAIWTRLPVSF